MKQGSNNKRPRRGGAPKGNRGPVRNQTFDSNCAGQRVRGTAQQVMEKYLAMARDAASSGDRILAENFYQHAEHYFRIANVNGALSNRIQQQGSGAHVPPTPAHDQTPLDDLFDYEEEAALQHQPNQQHGGNGRDQHPRGQQSDGGNGQARDEQPAPHQPQAQQPESGGDTNQGQGEDRPAKPRRARTRRKPADAEGQPPGGEEAPQAASGGEDADAPAKPARARRTRKAADKAEGAAAEDGGEAPAPRRRRAPARKKTSGSDEGGGDEAGSDDRREAVA
ncbi:DUF4167 domain-containing protein [Caenispirillum salinarum]|uniref:DUF4167 domain-containing protein n=1 Tax=Caenispirillum salinarum TaxID=859058 RepID=UPI00384D48C8